MQTVSGGFLWLSKKQGSPTRQGTVKRGTPTRRGTVNHGTPTLHTLTWTNQSSRIVSCCSDWSKSIMKHRGTMFCRYPDARVSKSPERASGARSHKSCCGATFTSMIKYFWLKKSKLLHKHPSYHVYCTKLNSIKVSNPFVQGFLGFGTKLCRELRCFRVKFYVANHAVFGATF